VETEFFMVELRAVSVTHPLCEKLRVQPVMKEIILRAVEMIN